MNYEIRFTRLFSNTNIFNNIGNDARDNENNKLFVNGLQTIYLQYGNSISKKINLIILK